MKKRGFTLVELLGIIVILAIIALLAVGGYGKITENVKKQSYNNVVALIETKAGEYASDTGNLLTNVGKLVELGYLEADDEEGNVKNPIDGSSLNCHIVSIIKDNNSLYGEYSEEQECDLNKLNITNMNLNILKYETTDTNFKNTPALGDEMEKEWTNQNVYLVATLGEKLKGQEGQIKKITWTSNVGSEERKVDNSIKGQEFESQNKYLVVAQQLINTEYTVRIELENETVYQASTSVKIDKQRPVIYEVLVDRPDDWTTEKKITITANDGNGSGIAGFAFTKDNNDCQAAKYEEGKESNKNIFEITKYETGTFYVCAKDKAGNYSEDKSTKIIEVKNIDKNPPEVNVKENPLLLGNGDYEFKNNLEVKWSESGEGIISCNPTISKKTGEYDVTCSAIGKNGLSTTVTFKVKHSYPATLVPRTCPSTVHACCKNTGECQVSEDDSINCTYECSRGVGKITEAKSRRCNSPECPDGWTGYGDSFCGDFQVRIDCSYYTCPQGGNPIGDTCYY